MVNGVSTDCVLDNSMFVRELHNGLVKATYFMGQSGPAYRRDDANGGTVRWYLYDGLGSVLGEIDPNGNITARRKYDVYGMTRAGSDAGTSKHKFVGALGHPSEDETGLIYMRAWYYDPQIGRFISEDPDRHEANCFMYCCNSPVNLVDAEGTTPLSTAGSIFGALGEFFALMAGASAGMGMMTQAVICAKLAIIAFACFAVGMFPYGLDMANVVVGFAMAEFGPNIPTFKDLLPQLQALKAGEENPYPGAAQIVTLAFMYSMAVYGAVVAANPDSGLTLR